MRHANYLTFLLFAAATAHAFAQPSIVPPKGFGQVSSSVSPDDATRMIALNAVVQADPERGLPILDGILKGSASPALKDRALSLLANNNSPAAHQALLTYAGSASTPDLQLRAIRYLGRSRTAEGRTQLAALYPSATDASVKREILRSLASADASDSVLAIAKSEKDPQLHAEAVRTLANSDATPVANLTALYAAETDSNTRRSIISGLAAHDHVTALIELARHETDPAMKASIVQRLGSMSNNKEAMDYMMEVLR